MVCPEQHEGFDNENSDKEGFDMKFLTIVINSNRIVKNLNEFSVVLLCTTVMENNFLRSIRFSLTQPIS